MLKRVINLELSNVVIYPIDYKSDFYDKQVLLEKLSLDQCELAANFKNKLIFPKEVDLASIETIVNIFNTFQVDFTKV